jgi:hypothetical protein
MGGSFTKSVGTFVTKNLDPLHQVGLGKYSAKLRKVVDPLNIMDPLNVLPTSGGKWLTVDKNYGAPLMNWISPKQSSYAPMTKGLSSNPEYFHQQQQVLQNMQAQQREKLANLRTQSPTYPTTTAATTSPATTTATAATSPTTATLAQTKTSDTTMPSDLPIDFTYKPTTTTPKVATANTFSLPDMSSIKFGGA